ncbi:hypothetical protein [Nostoc sp. ATCC 53789]|uniref:hypothetical protein n=1 Tax=Nostoc sp. ATCC 53789 TaxID=76335 RepID=UPI0011BEBC39|nr:hypothetical protein [Nostoc sp. ATCC 53789]QHG14989.1 hypothetical protein GJB62_02655 [Nostoc sp. ATCC 53789]
MKPPCLPDAGRGKIQSLSPFRSYGVHTSREIPPDTWFRHLAIGLCDGVPARRRRSLLKPVRSVRAASRREEERRSQERVADKQSTLTTGLRDYFAPLSLRS